jgi:hypothetical protein
MVGTEYVETSHRTGDSQSATRPTRSDATTSPGVTVAHNMNASTTGGPNQSPSSELNSTTPKLTRPTSEAPRLGATSSLDPGIEVPPPPRQRRPDNRHEPDAPAQDDRRARTRSLRRPSTGAQRSTGRDVTASARLVLRADHLGNKQRPGPRRIHRESVGPSALGRVPTPRPPIRPASRTPPRAPADTGVVCAAEARARSKRRPRNKTALARRTRRRKADGCAGTGLDLVQAGTYCACHGLWRLTVSGAGMGGNVGGVQSSVLFARGVTASTRQAGTIRHTSPEEEP